MLLNANFCDVIDIIHSERALEIVALPIVVYEETFFKTKT